MFYFTRLQDSGTWRCAGYDVTVFLTVGHRANMPTRQRYEIAITLVPPSNLRDTQSMIHAQMGSRPCCQVNVEAASYGCRKGLRCRVRMTGAATVIGVPMSSVMHIGMPIKAAAELEVLLCYSWCLCALAFSSCFYR